MPALPNFLTRNLTLRLIAVLLGLGLWLFVNAGQHEAQTSIDVPISYRGLPGDMAIVNQRPDFVALQVSGPRTLLSLLDPGRLAIKLDLTGVAPGQASFKINPEMFAVPRQTSVTRISPSQVVLDIDRLVTREVPVHLDVIGATQSGYAIAGVELKPASVSISGPSREVSKIEKIQTEPFDVRGLEAEAERPVALVIPPGPLRLSPVEVDARVRVEEVMGEREFRTVDIAVREPAYKYRLYPRQASVTVHGPLRRLFELNLAGLVYVDARGAEPGVHEVPVQVDLPQGLQVMHQTPDKVKLRMLAAKAEARS
jgi:YbbR domain-containing protein